MKHRIYTIMLVWLAATFAAVPAATAQTVDSIVAVVNNDIILSSQLNAAVRQARAKLGPRAADIPIDTLRSNVLDQLIFARLQLQRAKQLGLTVSKAEISQGIARLAQQNGMQPNQFIQALSMNGIPLDAVKQRIRTTALIHKVRLKEVMKKVSVTQADVTQFLQSESLRNANNREYHVRAIRLGIPATAGAMTVQHIRDRIESIRDEALSGKATFAELARKNSDGANAARGGDMGWLGSAFMPESFMDIVPQLQDGQISQVFRGDGAFHLIKLLGSRGSKNLAGGKVMVTEVKVQRIVLVPNALRNDARTRELALSIRQQLEAGGDFSALAKKYSDDDTTASQGGNLGWVQPQSLGSREATRIAQMQPGGISPILQTPKGYVIVKLIDRRREDKTRQAIRNRARQIIGERKSQEKGRRWLQKLRSEAYIDIRLKGYQPVSG